MTKRNSAKRILWIATSIVLALQVAGCSKVRDKETAVELHAIASEYLEADFLRPTDLAYEAARVEGLKFSDKSLASEARSFAETLRVASATARDIERRKQQFTEQGEAREMRAAKELREKAKTVVRVIENWM